MKHFLQTFLLLICVMGAMVSVKAQIVLSEDFESGSIGASWTQEQVSGTTSWTVPTSISYPSSGACEGSRSAQFKVSSSGPTTKLITPEMDLSGIAAPQLTFTHAQVLYSPDIDELYIYYRVSATDAWVELASYTSEFSTCTEETILLPNPSATYQIAFEAVSNYGYGVVLDQITVGAAPTCYRPTALDVAALTTISAQLSWTNGGGENAWNIEYGPAGFTQGNGTILSVTENPYLLEGLSANTNYDFYVQADCGGGDVSQWSVVGTFTTPCEAYTTLPYME
ncbi:MAG: fibronectin type III domain-containing protein, partial [Bacteroidales bacterium]|nr:fibronectin type III domain-containing protein [Bacteroidales bacterium]